MNKFGIILGEPNSINSEILAKSIAFKKNTLVIGSYDLFKSQLKFLKIKRKIKKIENFEEFKNSKMTLNIFDVPVRYKNPFSINPADSSIYVKKCLITGHRLCVEKKINGIINCSINKKNLFKNRNLGVTEFLAKKNKIFSSEVMLIYNKKLSVTPLTTHIKVKNISKLLKKKLIIKKIKTLNKYYFKYFNKKPRIAVLGLNPHNYELKKDSEEFKIIKPAIESLKKKFKISGPYPADTIFFKDNLKKYDVIVGMYHDQVLAPFKALFGFDAVNLTMGLPYIRMSPDHGVAEDKKKLNISNPQSLNKCIELISKLIR